MALVALVTHAAMLPEYFADDDVLVRALARRGHRVEYVCWDDPDARWTAADLAVLRSTWDYPRRFDAFRSWLDYVEQVVVLWNPPPLVRWNAHKGYVLDLEAAGVPTVPTRLVTAGTHADLGDGDWVVKPAVSGGADRTTPHATQQDLDALVATDDALAQPYLPEIESRGELSIVCVDGTVCHVLRKLPAAGDFRTQEHLGATVTREDISDAHVDAARSALGALDVVPLYARVDVVDSRDGLLLMELELIEPYLWLQLAPDTAEAMADAIERKLGVSPDRA